jgi:hypothetical protein
MFKRLPPLQKAFIPLLLVLALAGVMIILVATPWGAALSDDSFFYIKPARDLLAGRQIVLSAHHAPGLPFVLAAIGIFGVDPQNAIRFLNAFCFGLNIFLSGWMVSKITRMQGFGLAAALLVLLAQPLIEVHAWAMSEALFLSFILAAITTLARYLEKQQRIWLVVSGLLAGFSGLTRFAGAGMILAGTAVLLLAPGRRFTRRLLDAVIFGALGGLMYAVYPIVSSSASGQVGSMAGFKLAMPSQGSITDLLYNTLLWLMPGRLARGHEAIVMAIVILGMLGLVGLLALLRRSAFQITLRALLAEPAILILALFAAISLFVLYQANISDVYRSPFDFRLLSPTHLAIFLILLSVLGLVWKQTGRWIRAAMLIFFVLTAGIYASRALDTVQLYAERGMGFASSYWHDSDIVQYMRQLPVDTQLITTAPMAVYFSTGRETLSFANYTPEQLSTALKEKGGYFVLFNSMPFEMYGLDQQAYLAKLILVKEYSDSAVYQAR